MVNLIQELLPDIASEDIQPAPSDDKCAPTKQFEDYSCIPLNILIEMANAYNTDNPTNPIKLSSKLDTLNPTKHKRYLIHQFKQIFPNCKDQICWTKQSFIKKMQTQAQQELLTNTFRPTGPNGKFEWLNTIHIDDVMAQYENKYPDFEYLGTVPIDFDDLPDLGIKTLDFNELIQRKKTKLGIIFNLDRHDQSGSHWVAAYADLQKGAIYFFDSYGECPEPQIRKLLRRIHKFCSQTIPKPICEYNKIQAQHENSECGVYSINFILRLLKGDTFEQICNEKVADSKINKCRMVYFS